MSTEIDGRPCPFLYALTNCLDVTNFVLQMCKCYSSYRDDLPEHLGKTTEQELKKVHCGLTCAN